MIRISVRLTPRAKRDAIEGWRGDVLRVRVVAPPVDGKANEALVRLLAGALGVPKSGVAIVAGAASRDKTVEVRGLAADEARRRLGAPAL